MEPDWKILNDWACGPETTELDLKADAFAENPNLSVFVPKSASKGFYVGWVSARRLAEARPMVTREAIEKAFFDRASVTEGEHLDDGFDDIHALQLPAPQPEASKVEAVVSAAELVVEELTTEHEVTPGLIYRLRGALAALKDNKPEEAH